MTSHKSRLIEPRAQTALPGARERAGWKRLPDDVLAEQVRRLAISAAVGAGLWTYGLLMNTVVQPLTVGAVVPRMNVMIDIAAIAASGLMFLYVRYSPHAPQVKTNAGLLYLVANAIGVALINSWTKVPATDAVHLSWNTVVILVGSMIMPATPRKMLAAAFVAASMDPLGDLDRASTRHARAVHDLHLRGVHAELRLRGRGHTALSGPPPSWPPASPGARYGQLPPGRITWPRRDGRGVARDASAC